MRRGFSRFSDNLPEDSFFHSSKVQLESRRREPSGMGVGVGVRFVPVMGVPMLVTLAVLFMLCR